MKRLDRDRYYGEVFGDEIENPKRPRKFLQDGIFFDGAGDAIKGSEVKSHTPAPSPGRPAKQPAKPKATVVDPLSNSESVDILNGKSVQKLKKAAKKLHKEIGGELPQMEGPGVKAALVTYLSENAEV